MDYDGLIQVISTLGFPIIMSLILLYFLIQEKEDHKKEMIELKNVIAQNNEVLAGLKQLIEDKLKWL